MKNVIAFIILLTSVVCQGQTDSLSKWRIGVGFAASLSYRWMAENDALYFDNQKEFIANANKTDHASLGYQANVVFERRINNIGLSIGARYARTKFKREEDFTIIMIDPNDPLIPFDTGQTVEVISSFETVTIGMPLTFRYYKRFSKKALVFGVGVNNQFLLHQRQVRLFDGNLVYDGKNTVNRGQYLPEIQLNIGMEAAIGSKLRLLVEPFFKANLLELHTSSRADEYLYDVGVSMMIKCDLFR